MNRIRKLALGAATLALLAGGVSTARAESTTNWQLASGTTHLTTTGVASFNFTTQDKTRLLFNGKDGSLLGDGLSKTMTATFAVDGVHGAFTYAGEPSCGGTTGNVRLYFESIPPGAKFAYTNYWWSDTASAVLANGTLPLSAVVDPSAQWSDWDGKLSSAKAAEFSIAARNITAVGLSFGGGCFFENGVGTTDGSGTFTLNSFSVS